MKTKLILLSLFCALPLFGKDISFAWDASPTVGITNYALVAIRGTNVVGLLNAGTNLTTTAKGVPPGLLSWFVLAQKGGLSADPSNVVVVEVPAPAVNARVILNEVSVDMTNWTNVSQIYLRMKPLPGLPPMPK
jgi:hypothetical protein